MTIVFAFLFAAIALFHFKNPMPLIQIPEPPHHLYFMPPEIRRALAVILEEAGHKVYGQFVQGADQVLMQNGTTVLALRTKGDPASALVIPVKGNGEQATLLFERARKRLMALDLRVNPIPIPGTAGLILRLQVEGDLGFDIAFRPSGQVMGRILGFPKFKKFH